MFIAEPHYTISSYSFGSCL